MSNYKFYQNKECEFFPCQKTDNIEKYNCKFCYCPLYHDENCGGQYAMLDNGLKDCSQCLLPHHNADYIIDKLMNK